MESAIVVIVVLVAWFAVNRWVLPRLGIAT